jgi:hypothetical protein
MNVSGSNRYTINDLRTKINDALLDKEMPDKLYKSIDRTTRLIGAIINTRGDGWAAHVIDNEGKEMLTHDEQEKFTRAFQPYLDSIIEFFDSSHNESGRIGGGEEATTDETHTGPDEMYKQIIDKFGTINSAVNGFASKYGVLRLEKEHDIEQDIRLIPEALRQLIATGTQTIATAIVPAASTMPIADKTNEILDKIKVPFKLIISFIYLFLDVARIVVSINGSNFGRKILSITLSLLEFLRGDWKKAVLSFIGYYGMTPMLVGQTLKAILTLFRMVSPELQDNIIYGTYDSTKSFLVGLLLAIFQVTAPEEIRLPLIRILQKISDRKSELDTSLEAAGLERRPDYLAPSFEDLNNIQAVIADPDFVCSTDFQDMSSTISKSGIFNIVLQLLGIPTDPDTIKRKCGERYGKTFVEILASRDKTDNKLEVAKQAESIEKSSSTETTESAPAEETKATHVTEVPAESAEVPAEEVPAEAQETKATSGGRRKIRRPIKTFA